MTGANEIIGEYFSALKNAKQYNIRTKGAIY